MLKETIISVYFFLIRIVFGFFNRFPLRTKTVFLSSFGDNAFFVANAVTKIAPQPLIFLNRPECRIDFSYIPAADKKSYSFESANIIDMLVSLFHLATARTIFIDSYVGLLAVLQFREEVKCIQLWHASGAIKRFGWCEPSTNKRNNLAKRRFQAVYNQFHYIPLGCQEMSRIFKDAFRLSKTCFLPSGVPQTDFYFDAHAQAAGMERVYQTYPQLYGKRVMLYAPTFRKNRLHSAEIELNTEKLLAAFSQDDVLLLRLHPSVKNSGTQWNDSRIVNVSDYPHVAELLLISDVLITDYSSLSIDYSFLRRKMIFFLYDFETYQQEQGIWGDGSLFFPGPIVRTTEELINHLSDLSIDLTVIDRFHKYWNAFSTGTSSSRLVKAIYEEHRISSNLNVPQSVNKPYEKDE